MAIPRFDDPALTRQLVQSGVSRYRQPCYLRTGTTSAPRWPRDPGAPGDGLQAQALIDRLGAQPPRPAGTRNASFERERPAAIVHLGAALAARPNPNRIAAVIAGRRQPGRPPRSDRALLAQRAQLPIGTAGYADTANSLAGRQAAGGTGARGADDCRSPTPSRRAPSELGAGVDLARDEALVELDASARC
jgi:hypothetical protein